MDVPFIAGMSDGVGSVKVAQLCREQGISRQTFYSWRRFGTGGFAGLEELARTAEHITAPGERRGGGRDRATAQEEIGADARPAASTRPNWSTAGPGSGASISERETLGCIDWYNLRRLNIVCGDLPPVEFEASYYRNRVTSDTPEFQ